jgi:hypothetical protein
MPHARCSRARKKHVASGEVSDVIQVLPQEIGAGQSVRDRGRARSHGTAAEIRGVIHVLSQEIRTLWPRLKEPMQLGEAPLSNR